jgi:hypothetical protein
MNSIYYHWRNYRKSPLGEKLQSFWSFINRPLVVACLSLWILTWIYTHYNMIDILNKTIFDLPYAYEYSYMGATNDPGNRSKKGTVLFFNCGLWTVDWRLNKNW